MENVKSKRRPVTQQDDVDLAIEKMKHKWRYNPFRQYWWRYLILFAVVFMIFSFIAPAWSSGGAGGVATILVQLAIQIAMSALFAIFFIYIQFFAIARPRVYWLKPYETGITFADYKGNPQVLELAREVVLLLKGSKDFKNMGGEAIRGLLLEGDPGVGKSYLAQAIATEAGLPFGYCSSPSLQSPFLAGGMLSIKSLFRKARKLSAQYGGCILFLDEIDAIGQARNGSNGGGIGVGMGGMMGGGNLLINELLVQLDPPPVDERWTTKFLRWVGLELRRKKADRPVVLTIGATNLVSTLDPALIRPGRFDRVVTVDKPDAEGRREVIEYYLDKVNHENVPINRLVDETIGYTPVEIKGIINEAVIRAHFNGRDALTYRDLMEARDLREVGIRQPIRGMSREDKRRIAYHETGHAVAQVLLVPWERLVKLTIIRHGDALGFMQPKPREERYVRFKEELEVRIQVSLASRAAEELFLGSGSTGFSGDLISATRLAYVLCAEVGMNDHLSSATALGAPAASYQREIEDFLQDQFKRVKTLLEANADMCHALAAELLEREEMLGDEVQEIVDQFEPKLTNDAKLKRKKIGFVHNAEEAKPRVEIWTDGVPLAPTGTEGAVAYRPVGNTAPQVTVTVEPPAPAANPYSYSYPTQSAPVQAPPTPIQVLPVYDVPPTVPVYTPPPTPVQAAAPIYPVQTPPPAYTPPPVQQEIRPAQPQEVAPPAPAPAKPRPEDDEDDMLPRGW